MGRRSWRLVAITLAAVVALAGLAPAATKPPQYHYVALDTLGGNSIGVADFNNKGQLVGEVNFSFPGPHYHTAIWDLAGQGTDLGAQWVSGSSEAWAINDKGQVVGGQWSGSIETAFLWTAKGGKEDLGAPSGFKSSEAWFINKKGQVAGFTLPAAGWARGAFFWSPKEGMKDLGKLGGVEDVLLHALNGLGQVVGQASTPEAPDYPDHAFSWTLQDGMMKDLGTLQNYGWSAAWDVNDKGQIVGWSDIPGGGRHAVLWTGTGSMQDLQTLGGQSSMALAINSKGQVVGTSDPPEGLGTRTFIWSAKEGMKDLGTLGGDWVYLENKSINSKGQVVGFSYLAGNEVSHGFLWSQKTGMLDLNDLVVDLPPGMIIEEAYAINDKGMILAVASQDSTRTECLLVPK